MSSAHVFQQHIYQCSSSSVRASLHFATSIHQAEVYDVRPDSPGPLSGADQWLNTAKMIDAIGAEVDLYEECDDSVYAGFESTGDWMKPIQDYILDVLAKILVLNL